VSVGVLDRDVKPLEHCPGTESLECGNSPNCDSDRYPAVEASLPDASSKLPPD
jgi:hypothetical protein